MKTTTEKSETSETKEKLLNAGEMLMLEKGFVATSVDEICEAAKVTKGSFFHYFDSKEDFGKALVKHFSGKMHDAMSASDCACESTDPLERVYGFIDFAVGVAKNPKNRGCLVGTFAQELYKSHPEIRQACCASFEAGIAGMKKSLNEAKAKYAPHAVFDADALAEMYFSIVQGSLILIKASKDQSIMERTLQNYKQYIKSLFGR